MVASEYLSGSCLVQRTTKSYRSLGDSMGVAAPVGRGVGCVGRGAKVASSMLGTTEISC